MSAVDYRAFAGEASTTAVRGRFPVDLSSIGRWCDAVGDANPIFRDAAMARELGFAGIPAPPAMLDTWTAVGFDLQQQIPRPNDAATGLLEVFREQGYGSVLATNCDQAYHRYLTVGDHPNCVETVADISAEKTTGVGVGYFVTVQRSYRDDGGVELATMDYRRFYFRAHETPPPAKPPSRVASPGTEPREERSLPVLEVPVTRSLIVAGAVASADYYPGHHDPDFAQAAGLRDIFMNIRTTNGWVARYVGDRAGPEARLRRIALRLGTPNYPGDTMRFSGHVDTGDGDGDPPGVSRLNVEVRNARGVHASAVVEVERTPERPSHSQDRIPARTEDGGDAPWISR